MQSTWCKISLRGHRVEHEKKKTVSVIREVSVCSVPYIFVIFPDFFGLVRKKRDYGGISL